MLTTRLLRVALILLVGGLCANHRALDATTLVPAGVAQLAREAPLIVLGTVDDVSASRNPSTGRVERRVAIVTERVPKGGARGEVSVVVPGGTVGRYRTVMVGAPDFVAGEQVVLFLAPRADGEWGIVGLSQGVFRVADLAIGRVVIPPPIVRVNGDAPDRQARLPRGAQAGRVVRVEEFLEAIAASLAVRTPARERLP